MTSIKGKKLLILGGTALACGTVEKAKQMGVFTIVTDDREDSPAKKVSDASFMVSATDVEALVDLCKEQEVDGVLTTYHDRLLPYAQEVSDRLGLPYLATAEQLEMIRNKKKSKNLCIEYGIPVPREYPLTEEFRREHLDAMDYPVLIKPVDSSGQHGISICRNEQELRVGYQKALEFSYCKEVVIEKYLDGDYVVLCFTIQDGFVSLSAMADKPVIDERYSNGLIRLPKAYVLPSKYLDLFYDSLFDKIGALSDGLGLRNGSWGMEGIVNNGTLYIFEMQYRLGGMKHEEFVLKENGVDIMGMQVTYALTGEFSGSNIKEEDNPYFEKTYCLLNVLIGPGRITEIEGVGEVRALPEVLNFVLTHQVGDLVELTGTTRQICAKISLAAESKERLLEITEYIHERFKVIDDQGKNMLLGSITRQDLFETSDSPAN